VAELLPAQRGDPEARDKPEPVPRGDGPNSPWFDWRRARLSGTTESEEESGSEDEAAAAAADRASETDDTSEALPTAGSAAGSPSGPASGSAAGSDPADDAGAAPPTPRPFPWFG